MSKIAHGWICDTCKEFSVLKPWPCPVCGKIICENCFDRYMLCNICSSGKTDDECKKLAKWDDEE